MLIQKGKKKRAVQKIEAARCAEMSDLIDRSAAIDAADRADYTGLSVEDVKKVTDEVVKELKQLPPAQPEPLTNAEIVRCGDCRWNDGTAYCEFHYRAVNGDDFCSWGEKK